MSTSAAETADTPENTKHERALRTSPNLLADSGLPLAYKAAPGAPVRAPGPRLGESVRTVVNSLTVFQKEAFVTSHGAQETWRLASDEGKYLNGHDAGPPPLAFLTVGMVASYMNELQALAQQRGVPLGAVTLIQDNYYSMDGSMRQRTMVAGADHVDLDVVFDSSADDGTLQALAFDAVAAAPLNGLIRGEKKSLFTLTHNGRRVDNGDAPTLHAPAVDDPADIGGQAEVVSGDWSDLIQRGGLTPKSAITDSFSGSSLTDQQNRLLHLRGICTMREDGVKVIEQQLFNPHGSIYTFLSDETSAADGGGRAPNAASYISAGIGFCFMTQLGRFAKMQDSKLRGYRIVQDSHFSLGGGSGKTGKAGAADPIETHVFLESDEDDQFARDILDMSEQTCFLHALCRTDLKTRVRVRRA